MNRSIIFAYFLLTRRKGELIVIKKSAYVIPEWPLVVTMVTTYFVLFLTSCHHMIEILFYGSKADTRKKYLFAYTKKLLNIVLTKFKLVLYLRLSPASYDR